jgi:hypothetical protein
VNVVVLVNNAALRVVDESVGFQVAQSAGLQIQVTVALIIPPEASNPLPLFATFGGRALVHCLPTQVWPSGPLGLWLWNCFDIGSRPEGSTSH